MVTPKKASTYIFRYFVGLIQNSLEKRDFLITNVFALNEIIDFHADAMLGN